MGFMKYANACLVHPTLQLQTWDNRKIRTASKSGGAVSTNLIDQASEIFKRPFDPNDYLLSHVTIIASVDTQEVASMKTGSLVENGQKINRKYADFRITPETQQWVNNNEDAWSRDVIKRSYRTFIGAHNFQEHVQIEELSKGRIIDAALRDIGPSLYVDILVATDRKHAELIRDIEAGKMSTLSMGCSIDFSVCTKCGHVAADETEMCRCIRYEKGNIFYDKHGHKHRTAELCGHQSYGDTGGVTFIEGSWVATPAFGGAVLRNIITPNEEVLKKAQLVLSQPPVQWVEGNMQKSAYLQAGETDWRTSEFDFDEEEEGADESEESTEEDQGGSGWSEVEDEAYKTVKDRVLKRIKDELKEKDQSLTPEDSTMEPNDSIIKEASEYRGGINALIKTAKNDAEFINNVATYNRSKGIDIPVEIYRASLRLGSTRNYNDLNLFLQRSQEVLGRKPSEKEARTLIRLAKLLGLRKG